jgi:carbamoyl-phosphate synthase small subunit
MIRTYDRKLVLPDGTEYYGFAFGGDPGAQAADGSFTGAQAADSAALPGCSLLELVFNTSMAGYQEILSDPSYTGQAVVMSYPLIGNYGMAEEDYESDALRPGALIVREYNPRPSNFRSVSSLGEVMREQGVPGLWGIDTRSLVRRLRTDGSMMAAVAPASLPLKEILPVLREAHPRTDTVPSVSIRRAQFIPAEGPMFHIAVIDCGIKRNILRVMHQGGADLTVLPWNTTAEQIRALKPDGVFISNGPGDPADVPETEETIRNLIGTIPVFGICLGHQLIARAMGADTYKLHFGHRGGNHPVKNLLTGKVEITSQNHSFAVDEATLPGTGLAVTHRNLLDNTVEGLSCLEKTVFCVQYHPESAPGPQDSSYLFREFFQLMQERKRSHA